MLMDMYTLCLCNNVFIWLVDNFVSSNVYFTLIKLEDNALAFYVNSIFHTLVITYYFVSYASL